ncbi:MAG: DUF5069 domain-containing protein [Chthoniobacterales bacterium]
MNIQKVRGLALDLNQTAPRSPRVALSADFPAMAARVTDKCRAELAGVAGSYHYNCPLDRQFFAATGLEAAPLREFIASGAEDAEVASWMSAHATSSRQQIIAWGRRMRRNPFLLLLEFDDWLHRRRNGHSGRSGKPERSD